MKIAICDDNRKYVNTIESFLHEICMDIDFEAFYSGEDLLRIYNEGWADYDVIFLDMEMAGMTGIQTANLIREKDHQVIIVFITSFTKYMKECFVCEPFRFLVKPVTLNDIKKVCGEIQSKISKARTTFVFNEERRRLRLFCDEIIYFECQRHYITVVTDEDRYRTRMTISKLLELIPSNMFFRVHKSFVVNYNYVKEITENHIKLYNSENMIPISRNLKKAFIKGFVNFAERKSLI